MLILIRVRPIEFGVAASSTHDGIRTISTPVNILSHDMPNLVIWTHERVIKILFEEKKAIGVEAVSGKMRQTC
jgi:hypothetical protein